jgi:hypothetical protein
VVHPVITAFKSLKQTFMGKNLEDLQQWYIINSRWTLQNTPPGSGVS